MITHSSILAYKIPWTEEPGIVQFRGLQRVGHNWTQAHTHINILSLFKFIILYYTSKHNRYYLRFEIILLTEERDIYAKYLLLKVVLANADIKYIASY